MNSKKKEFLISLSLVFTFIFALILSLIYVFMDYFVLNKTSFVLFSILFLAFALGILFWFSSSILKVLFSSDEKLQDKIKKTIHELNIPVSTIKINVQLLQKKLQDRKNLKRLDRIEQANNNLLKLYEDMEYDIKKQIDKIDKQEFFLDEIIKDSLDRLNDFKTDIKIELNIPHIALCSDKNGFKKIVDNLLVNAIKYNDEINPLIKIDFQNDILAIYNNGKQIDTKNLFLIFEKHFQTDYLKDGFGLGLFVVKEYCDKNKIVISIDAQEYGNRFNLNLKNIIVR